MDPRGTRTRLRRRRVLAYALVVILSAAVLVADGWAYFAK